MNSNGDDKPLTPLDDAYYNEENTLLYNIKRAGIYDGRDRTTKECIAWRPNECFAINDQFPGYLIGNRGTIYDIENGRKVRNRERDDHYYQASFAGKGLGPKYSKSVHRSVMLTHGMIADPEKKRVNHKNRIKADNYYNPYDPNSNLEWTTDAENFHHAIRSDKENQSGRYQTWTPYSDRDIIMICKMVIDGYIPQDIAIALGVPETRKITDMIGKIRERRARVEVAAPYLPLPLVNTKNNAFIIDKISQLISAGDSVDLIQRKFQYNMHRPISEEVIICIRMRHPNYWIWFPIIDQYDFSRASF